MYGLPSDGLHGLADDIMNNEESCSMDARAGWTWLHADGIRFASSEKGISEITTTIVIIIAVTVGDHRDPTPLQQSPLGT